MKKPKKHLTFSIRTALIVMACLAIVFGIWARVQNLQRIAARHHFEAMEHGYRAASIQIPPQPRLNGSTPPSFINVDRETLAKASEHWLLCMHHARLRDAYLSASRSPWLPLSDMKEVPDLQEPSDLVDWWHNTVLHFIAGNPSLLYNSVGIHISDPKNANYNATLLTEDQISRLQSIIDSDAGNTGIAQDDKVQR